MRARPWSRSRRTRTTPRRRTRSTRSGRRRSRAGKMQGPIEVDVNPAHTVARVTIPLQGEGTDARSNAALRQLRKRDPAGDRRHRPRRDLRGHRRHGRVGRRELAAQAQVADRVRVRAHARLRAPARLVPLGRRRGQGGRPQPALRRRRVRRARRRLPVGLGREPARLPQLRRRRVLAADLHVRDPVRALDGLPRVHPEPDPRGLRPRHADGGRGRARDQDDRRRRSRAPRS